MAEDIVKFLDEIRPIAGSYGAGFEGKLDRYRDYRAVFMDGNASGDTGRRVLWDLLAQCRLWNSPIMVSEFQGTDSLMTFAVIGRQNIGRWIFATLTEEPSPNPERVEE